MTPRRILAAGWLAFLLYSYPGYMKVDGEDMLSDSRVGVFTDWHSPMMTEVWRIVGRVISGPAGMLLLQSILLLAGSYVLLKRVLSERAAAIAAVCVLVCPPIMATTALVSAETQLASFLVAGAAALASDRRRMRLLGLGLVVIACGMRPGATLAALPLVLTTFRWDDDVRPRWQRLAIATAAWAAGGMLAYGVDRLLADDISERSDIALAMGDIVGSLDHAGPMSDVQIQQLLTGVRLAASSDLQKRARDLDGHPPKYAASDERLFEPPSSAAERDALFAARRALARAAPGAYLHHRWRMLHRELGFGASWSPLYTEFVANPADRRGLRHAAWHSLAQRTLIGIVRPLSHTFLFRPWIYAVLALVLLPVAAVRRQPEAIALLASGIAYELVLMFETTRSDYRDSHWLIVATVLSIITLVARRLETVRASG